MAVYFVLPRSVRNFWLMLASVVFYSWGGWAFLPILFVSVIADYALGFLAARGHTREDPRLKRLAVGLSVAVNIGLLGYFKYANFFVEEFDAAFSGLGFDSSSWTRVALPIGISFFTFQSMSYTIDVARGAAAHLRSPIDFAMYVSLFPQLIAGPIVRFHEMAAEISDRVVRREDFAEGALRFAHGLAKKVIIADAVGPVADAAFAASSLSATEAWVGILAYTVQIYFDFSGYSDMAIGLGRMLGFRFPENFNRPYSAVSITDFWRRWHITLSNWFRDYVYIPLGGSQKGVARTYSNLVFVFLVTGLWHGANWTFVIWGAYHGLLLIAERVIGQRPVGDGAIQYAPLRRATTFVLVVVGWVLFRAESLGAAWLYLRSLIPDGGFGSEADLELSSRTIALLAIALVVVLLPRGFSGSRLLTNYVGMRPAAARLATVLLLAPYSAALVLSGTFSPFLYFQF
ncbi:MAG: MBOAT family protein [Acidimicrobiia bacterium]|nr:MBOAT family protein [Acidimicrobiia bacterium]